MSKAKATRKTKGSIANERYQEQRSDVLEFLMTLPEISEAWTSAELDLAMEDVGWTNMSGARFTGEIPQAQRDQVVKRCRFYWHHDPLAKQAVRLWTDYALGSEGFTVETTAAQNQDSTDAKAKEAFPPSAGKKPAPKTGAIAPAAGTEEEDDPALQAKIDGFLNDPRNRRLTSAKGQVRLSKKQLVDGEVFFAIFGNEIVRTIDPLEIKAAITNPEDKEEIFCWTRQGLNDGSKPRYYRDAFVTDDQLKEYSKGFKDPFTGQTVTPDDLEDDVLVYHAPFDDLNLRGNSLLSSVIDWTTASRKFMEARVAIVQALSKYAHKYTAKGGQATITAVANRLKSSLVDTGTAAPERNPKPAPGSSFVKNAGLDIDVMPRATGAGDAESDGNQLKLMVCSGTGIMLHYFGDPSTGNLATATAMELPMLKQFGGYQKSWKDIWTDLICIALKLQPAQRSEIDIDYPPIIEEDAQKFSALVTSLTAAFPELKVDQVRKRALQVLGVEDVDTVMDTVKAQHEENKANADANAKANLAVLTAKAGADPKTMLQQSEAYVALYRAIEKMQEKQTT